ncbi:HAD family hydrolase [uncultured Muribaculum sp.]|uniref:KdsC family phosphatase n=1 Tax=uncultured Muribaculum sp. TaxID=1918613 RepID=UPI0025EAF22F|nr:HAD hydrolase family protein [uncultured Muribaculum sp.]
MSKIDYDLRLIRGIAFDVDGVLSPSCIPLGADGMPQRMVNIKDGYAIQLAVKCGYHIAIITGGDSQAIHDRFSGLGVKDIYMKAGVKIKVLHDWMSLHGLRPEEVAYAGDDIPDYEVMKHVGLPVAPRDAACEIKEAARYISPYDGGQGVGRDLLEEVMRAQGHWMNDAKAFGW